MRGRGLGSRWWKPGPEQAIWHSREQPADSAAVLSWSSRALPCSCLAPWPGGPGDSRREDLPQVARIGATEGIPALEEGKFDKANQLLSAAREAVDSLGGAVEDADEIRHAADEAAIFVNLLSDPLESLLDEAARTSPQAWAARFDTLYKGRAVIIDATITATPETAGSHRYEIDYLVLTPGEGTREPPRCPHRPDRLRGDHPGPAQGGRSRGLRRPAGRLPVRPEAQEWLIRFEPKSGVSIKYMKALETLGWPSGSCMPDESPERPDQP